MEPNYENASAKATDTIVRFGLVPSSADLLRILNQLPNVSTFAFDISPVSAEADWDAFTFVRKKNGVLQYVIMFNNHLPSYLLRRTLARELGHVVLDHDGTGPEDVWMEEANCFAYHLLCCQRPRAVTIHFRPDLKNLSLSFKSMQSFSSLDALKQFIAEEQTRISHFIGKDRTYHPSDVEVRHLQEKDFFSNWRNFSSVVVAGRPVGYCGE